MPLPCSRRGHRLPSLPTPPEPVPITLPPALTRDEIEQVLADGLADAEASTDADGFPGELSVAEAWALLATAWDDALRPLLDASGLLAYAEGALDPDGDGTVQREHVALFATAVTSALSVVFVATALAPFVSRVLGSYREARAHTQALPAVAAWAARGAGTAGDPGVVVDALLGGPDRAALAWLRRYSGFWITTASERRVEPVIAEVAERVLSGGLSLDDAAAEMAGALRAVHRGGVGYWRLVADAAVSRGQMLARVNTFEQVGADGAYVSAVRDSRTSDVCRFLHGRFVPMETLRAERSALLSASDVDGWKAASPWFSDSDLPRLRSLVNAAGGDVPPSVGTPQYHGRCRSTLIIRPPAR